MGGNLAVTLRLSDGLEYRMDRWTNSLPQTIHDAQFLSEDPAAISEYLEPWQNMKADWEKNRVSEAFEQPMTTAYAPYPFGLRPSTYGAVVICFKTRTILSLQGYCDIGARYWHDAALSFSTAHHVEEVAKLSGENRIAGYSFITGSQPAVDHMCKKLPGTTVTQIEGKTGAGANTITVPGTCDILDVIGALQEIFGAPETFGQRPVLFPRILVDMLGFTIEHFGEDADGYLALQSRIYELGFVLTDDEERAWAERIHEISSEA